MIKKRTGATFEPQEFRKLKQCLTCGKAENRQEELCADCTSKNFKRCGVCEVILRNGLHTFYTYDIKEIHRTGDFKISKEVIREFSFEKNFPEPFSDSMCKECVGWKNLIKNVCLICEKDFANTEENYKENGNCCQKCNNKIESCLNN